MDFTFYSLANSTQTKTKGLRMTSVGHGNALSRAKALLNLNDREDLMIRSFASRKVATLALLAVVFGASSFVSVPQMTAKDCVYGEGNHCPDRKDDPVSTPEPGTAALLGVGLAGFAIVVAARKRLFAQKA